MDRFDEVVDQIKGAWLATHKTVKDVEYEYEDYFHKTALSSMMLTWREKNPERIAKQIRDLIVEMEKLKHTAVLSNIEPPYSFHDVEDEFYTIDVRITYTERFDD